jgi:hypothetical protein
MDDCDEKNTFAQYVPKIFDFFKAIISPDFPQRAVK